MAKLEEMQTVYTKYPDIPFLAEPKIGARRFKRLENRTPMMWLGESYAGPREAPAPAKPKVSTRTKSARKVRR